MSRRKVWVLLSIAAVTLLTLTGAALAGGTFESDDSQLAGPQSGQAKAAALGFVSGTAGAVERDGEDGAVWEVEVTREDGSRVDVLLDEALGLVAVEGDSEGPDTSDD